MKVRCPTILLDLLARALRSKHLKTNYASILPISPICRALPSSFHSLPNLVGPPMRTIARLLTSSLPQPPQSIRSAHLHSRSCPAFCLRSWHNHRTICTKIGNLQFMKHFNRQDQAFEYNRNRYSRGICPPLVLRVVMTELRPDPSLYIAGLVCVIRCEPGLSIFMLLVIFHR